jgi:DNA polymerase III epsilon subunit-like protein
MKLAFLDVETTSLNPSLGEVTEVAIIIDDGESRKNLGKISLKFRPTKWDNIDPKSLEVTGKTIEDLEAYPDRDESFQKLIEFLDEHINKYDRDDKLYQVAHNLWFDNGFLRQMFFNYNEKHNSKHYYFSYFYIEGFDTIAFMTYFKILLHKEFENMKLGTLCKALKIPIDESKTHSSWYDTILLRKLFYKSDMIMDKFLTK